ncbi:TetR family transcriptional regulator [Nocardia neocaledoniensis NBRC 108232]|uniref:TetR family transcriptional regulator n=1 Tax=Nocardia neocaledoniensis TaxID=236511 RepID=A0A317NJ93_9NOCA|nr:TetR/AcrR family transcriptional regulator [Nocardia neocaledoniensis]PWV74953.1 TetR family transcriptional regulator [Nocardia neocaledoniensis]GEM30983.1 TetR family transcriptional regulator [Nocardia neocaledoniensis NBRC 108232]
MTGVVRPYRGVAAQTRLRERRQRVLEACLDLVAESGVADITVEAIAARAGLSKRYFYESFRDRDAVLVAAFGEALSPMGRELAAELSACSCVEERVERTARVLVRTFTSDRRVARLYTEAPGNGALAQARRQMVDEFTPLLVREVLLGDPADPRASATSMLMVAGTTEVLDRWLRGDLALGDEQFIRMLTVLGIRLAGAEFDEELRRQSL